ncbi:hypothetical protein EYZ11_006869 [Aspergillus tanneri]|uniref:Uncharacterized protein n=1 Tax=Aspergillus tanneri TaxID=1220188 RepID=A0A4S3JGN8_9EURO|nr:hypothetical protein EYZ11_006869 [Aspergillus tanneri]
MTYAVSIPKAEPVCIPSLEFSTHHYRHQNFNKMGLVQSRSGSPTGFPAATIENGGTAHLSIPFGPLSQMTQVYGGRISPSHRKERRTNKKGAKNGLVHLGPYVATEKTGY